MKVIIEEIGGEDKIKEATINTLKRTIQEAYDSNFATRVRVYHKIFGSYTEIAYISMIRPLEIHLNGYHITERELRVYVRFMLENSKPGREVFDLTWKENT